MANPFTYTPRKPGVPETPKEAQGNANYWTYERMAADADLADFDREGIRAPHEVISRVHTARWVEKEHIRLAVKARAKAKGV